MSYDLSGASGSVLTLRMASGMTTGSRAMVRPGATWEPSGGQAAGASD